MYPAGALMSAHPTTLAPTIPDTATVVTDCGFGFTRFEIQEASYGATGDPAWVTHISVLGWPQPLISYSSGSFRRPTPSASTKILAERCEALEAEISPASEIRFDWNGALFNVTTYLLPLLAAAAWIPSIAPSLLSRNRTPMTCVAAAWIVGLILPEWGLLTATRGGPGYPGLLHVESHTNPEEFGTPEGAALFTSTSGHSGRYLANERTNLTVTLRSQWLIWQDDNEGLGTFPRHGVILTAGWPLRAFVTGDGTSNILPAGDVSQLRARWLPWLTNVILLAVPIACLLAGPEWLTRITRKARGRCPDCGYPRLGTRTCSECGRDPGAAQAKSARVQGPPRSRGGPFR